jgi:hypothetical protein
MFPRTTTVAILLEARNLSYSKSALRGSKEEKKEKEGKEKKPAELPAYESLSASGRVSV